MPRGRTSKQEVVQEAQVQDGSSSKTAFTNKDLTNYHSIQDQGDGTQLPGEADDNDSQKTTRHTIRTSNRIVRKRVIEFDPSSSSSKHHRQCEKAGCTASVPICFASSNERCSGRGYTSRWYHVSLGEHFCNECFDHYYRSHKEGYKEYSAWKTMWTSQGRLEASLKAFMADCLLPFWAQCTLCQKWRQLSKDAQLTPEFLASFKCKVTRTHLTDSDACQMPEDLRVQTVYEPFWIDFLQLPALLKNSPASRWLQEYYADGVGLSPTSHLVETSQEGKAGINSNSKVLDLMDDKASFKSSKDFLQPFYQPTEPRKALCFRPDVMEPDELLEFPEFAKDQIMYLGVRNLIVALWNENPKDWLTHEKISQHLVCRGLSRIRCIQEAQRVLTFFTKKGIVNCGLVKLAKGFSLNNNQEDVLVIGAGPSGLAAAKHLHNLGFRVTVLEATKRIGGRVWDETSLGGVCVGRGAQIVTGVINNPISVMCEQLDIQMRLIGGKCELFHEGGRAANPDADQRVDFHFNAILDSVAEWRKSQENDTDLQTKLKEMHEFFLEETGIRFSEEERNLLQFHMSNLEYACGVSLNQVSSLHWDQNEQFPQFAGVHGLLLCGYGSLLKSLAQDIDIRFGQEVESIDYSQSNHVIVTTSDKKIITGTKVIITVPLSILQKGIIRFDPPLPEKKLNALKNLGSGLIEKVALLFPKRFWERKLGGADFFGHIPSSTETRGLFNIFYDLTPPKVSKKKESNYILMSYVSGEAVHLIQNKTDEEVVEMCLSVLRNIFSTETPVPQPTSWFVTHWFKEPHVQMAYSFIKVGGTGEAYDHLAEEINNTLFFAGEATNRQFPQSVSGALLSGIREAWKIIRQVDDTSNE